MSTNYTEGTPVVVNTIDECIEGTVVKYNPNDEILTIKRDCDGKTMRVRMWMFYTFEDKGIIFFDS